MKLFCFSYAGGTAEFYKELGDLLIKRNVEIHALDYPGHGSRRKESFSEDFYQLSSDMVRKIREYDIPNDDYALMGYSMGSITATEVVCRILEEQNMPMPKHIFLAAHAPTTAGIFAGSTAEITDKDVKERTISFGAVPAELLHNKTFWRVYMPLYRADYSMIRKYAFDELSLRTNIDATIFYSETDTTYSEMNRWRKHYVGDVALYEFSGDHFFIREHIEEITDIICARLLLL